jgi:hypothetical protein
MRAWIALFFITAGCGGHLANEGDASVDAAPDNVTTTTGTGVVVRACGPADGIVHAFVFSTSPLSCAMPYVADDTLTITPAGDVTGPTTITIGDAGATADYCKFAGCDSAVSGTLVVTSFGGGVASGHYTLTMPDASVLSASFTNIPICENVVTCG